MTATAAAATTTYTLSLPPAFYTTLQHAQYTFPHENGDILTDAELRSYWWDNYLFADYCTDVAVWREKRESEFVQILVPFYMRCKCLAEHLDFQHATPAPSFSPRIREKVVAQLTDGLQSEMGAFQYELDLCITVTQVLLYWYLVGSAAEEEEELCRKWRDAVCSVGCLRPGGLSQLKRMPAYVQRVKDIMGDFAEVRALVGQIQLGGPLLPRPDGDENIAAAE